MITDKPDNERDISPAFQFIIFLGVIAGLMLAGSLLGGLLVKGIYGAGILNQVTAMKPGSAAVRNALWVLQVAGMTIPLFLAPVIFARYIVRSPDDYLKNNFQFPGRLLIIVFLVLMMSAPVMEELVDLNRNLALPSYLKGLEDWMKNSEASAQKMMSVVLKMDTQAQFLFALLVVGLLTAIVEEMVFRGCLLTIFKRWTGNTHAAIWITAAIFSAIHLEFYGFLPRMALGVFFGYFAAWSGSIWPAIWAHFINNGSAVIFTYMYQHKQIDIDPDAQHTFNYTQYVLSLMITIALLYTYRTITLSLDKNQLEED